MSIDRLEFGLPISVNLIMCSRPLCLANCLGDRVYSEDIMRCAIQLYTCRNSALFKWIIASGQDVLFCLLTFVFIFRLNF